MRKIYHWLSNLVEAIPHIKRPIVRAWYDLFCNLDKEGNVLCMNYGYAGGDDAQIDLHEDDESHRYPLQLYHHTARAVELKGLDVLEIGSGRGGGASYLHRYFKPKSMVGVDFSKRATQFSAKRHKLPGLSFVHGNAEQLSFANDSFDVVLNIESSLHYPQVEKFVKEAYRVLRDGAYFLWADIRTPEEIKVWREMVKRAGFTIQEEEFITHNVLKALERDEERKMALMKKHSPKIFHPSIREFAALKGSRGYHEFESGKLEYWRFVMKKIAPCT